MWGKRIAPQQKKLLPFLPGSLLKLLNAFYGVCFVSWGPFLESTVNFSGPESCFCLPGLYWRSRYQWLEKWSNETIYLTKQNWLVCQLGTVLLFNRFWFEIWFEICLGAWNVIGPFEKRSPRLVLKEIAQNHRARTESRSWNLEKVLKFAQQSSRPGKIWKMKLKSGKMVKSLEFFFQASTSAL